MEESEKPLSRVHSLSQKRKEQNQQARKAFLPLDQRVLELEQDAVRMIDMLVEMNAAIDSQARLIRILTKALARVVDEGK